MSFNCVGKLRGPSLIIYRKLYVILYNVLESCYGANLGIEVSTSSIDAMSGILEANVDSMNGVFNSYPLWASEPGIPP